MKCWCSTVTNYCRLDLTPLTPTITTILSTLDGSAHYCNYERSKIYFKRTINPMVRVSVNISTWNMRHQRPLWLCLLFSFLEQKKAWLRIRVSEVRLFLHLIPTSHWAPKLSCTPQKTTKTPAGGCSQFHRQWATRKVASTFHSGLLRVFLILTKNIVGRGEHVWQFLVSCWLLCLILKPWRWTTLLQNISGLLPDETASYSRWQHSGLVLAV
jgi:hypothetical protein